MIQTELVLDITKLNKSNEKSAHDNYELKRAEVDKLKLILEGHKRNAENGVDSQSVISALEQTIHQLESELDSIVSKAD